MSETHRAQQMFAQYLFRREVRRKNDAHTMFDCPGNEIECWHDHCRWPDCVENYEAQQLLQRAAAKQYPRQFLEVPARPSAFGGLR